MSLLAFRFLLWYICVLFVQPQNRFPFLWPFHIADICIFCAVVFHVLACAQEKRPIIRLGPATLIALVLSVSGLLSLHLGPLQTSSAWNPYIDVLAKNMLLLILVEAMAYSVERVWAVQATMLLATLWWIKGGLRLSVSGGTYSGDRIMGAAVSLIENPNGFAYMMSIMIPLYLYFYQQTNLKYLKWFFLALALAGVFVVFETGSRTGLLALLSVGVFLLPKYGAQYTKTLIVGGVLVFVLLSYVGSGNLERFRSIPTSVRAFLSGTERPTSELTQDEQSAQDRRLKNRDTWRMIKEYPLFGVGICPNESLIIERFPMAVGQVHNEFLMAGKQLGLIGMSLYIGVLVLLFHNGWRIQKKAKGWWPAVSDMGWTFKMQTVVIVVGGLFSPIPFNPPTAILVACASSLWACLREMRSADGSMALNAQIQTSGTPLTCV